MIDGPLDLLEIVRPLLEEGESVWAVYPGRQSLVATDRRLFLVTDNRPIGYDLAQFAGVQRERDTLLVLTPAGDGPAIAVEVRPNDEAGLQAMTVIGLLVARQGRTGAAGRGRRPGPARRS